MGAQIIDGKGIAQSVFQELSEKLLAVKKPYPTLRPGLAFVRVGEDPASIIYLERKGQAAHSLGIESRVHVLRKDTTEAELLEILAQLNQDPAIHGILIQAPLPKHLDPFTVFNAVSPEKDVDGFHRCNLGNLIQDPQKSAFWPCTPKGILELLKRSHVEIERKHVVIVGRSLIVGKTSALLLLYNHWAGNATVTICHSRTMHLGSITKQADILIAATGTPHLIHADMVKPGAVVVDVGIHRLTSEGPQGPKSLIGDVNFADVLPKVSKITPVPGGVGPMTVAMLMQNTVEAFSRQISKPKI